MEEFNKNKPKLAALHWDGKLVKDVTGTLRENEAILVSGAPHYNRGKLLAVSIIKDEKGEPTSTREAQAQAVLAEIEKWDVKENIVALVFDTTASNTALVSDRELLCDCNRPWAGLCYSWVAGTIYLS